MCIRFVKWQMADGRAWLELMATATGASFGGRELPAGDERGACGPTGDCVPRVRACAGVLLSDGCDLTNLVLVTL